MASDMASIGIYILCGGASSRMGCCKTQVQYHGRALLTYILETAQSLEHSVHLVCKPHQKDALQIHDLPLILDASDQTHPLEGVLSAFNHADGLFQSILVLPCDTPRLSRDSILNLRRQTPSVIEDDTHRIHPLMLHLPLNWMDRCLTYLHSQGSMRDFAALAHRVTVPVHETININYPNELEQPNEVLS